MSLEEPRSLRYSVMRCRCTHVLHTVAQSIGKTAIRTGGRCSFDPSAPVATRVHEGHQSRLTKHTPSHSVAVDVTDCLTLPKSFMNDDSID